VWITLGLLSAASPVRSVRASSGLRTPRGALWRRQSRPPCRTKLAPSRRFEERAEDIPRLNGCLIRRSLLGPARRSPVCHLHRSTLEDHGHPEDDSALQRVELLHTKSPTPREAFCLPRGLTDGPGLGRCPGLPCTRCCPLDLSRFADSLSPARTSVPYQRLGHDEVHFPGLASVGGEGLLETT
jgi:hypothetical protein